MYLPERVYVKPQSRNDPVTAEIIRRVHAIDPKIPIIQMRGQSIPFPSHSTAVWRWRQRRKSIILSQRTVPFMSTFASPGNIVERLGVILNLCWHCPSDCHFCYLQPVLPPDQILYTNLEKLDREVAIEPYVHKAVLTIWSLISFVLKEELRRIPVNFHKAANYVRAEFLSEGVNNDTEAVEFLEDILRRRNSPLLKIMQGGKPAQHGSKDDKRRVWSKKPMDLGFKAKDLKTSRRTLSGYYVKNSTYPLRLNPSEFTDLIAYDHLCGYTKRLMDLVARHPEIDISLRTKSSYVDEMILCDGLDRVISVMNFNTPFVIEHYEPGTASLEERLIAAQKVQDAKGFRLGIVIEPMIKYPGYQKDYVELARRIMTSLDGRRVEDISLGCVRYSGKLEARVKRNFPMTDLFDDSQELLALEKHDRRRYPLDERVQLYRLVFDEFRKHTKAFFRLGAETPDAWEGLGLERTSLMQKSVYQYPGRQGKP